MTAEFNMPPHGDSVVPAEVADISRDFSYDTSLYEEPRWSNEDELSLTQANTFRQRIANTSIVAAAGVSLFIEQSPINEALRTNIALDTLEQTQSALAVGAAVAGATAVIEMVPSTFISLGLHREGGAVQKLKEKLSKKEAKLESESQDVQVINDKSHLQKIADTGANVGIALGLGAGLVTVKKHIQDPEPTLAKDMRNSVNATGIVAGVSGTIGYLVGGGIQNAEKIGLETPAEYVVDYGTDTRFWMGALAVGYGAYFAKKGIARLFNRKAIEE